jgi:hypothetical protein
MTLVEELTKFGSAATHDQLECLAGWVRATQTALSLRERGEGIRALVVTEAALDSLAQLKPAKYCIPHAPGTGYWQCVNCDKRLTPVSRSPPVKEPCP